MSLSVGTRVGPYEITGTLGAGGMGEVYRARDKKLSRDVALKMLPEIFARDPDRRARFEREATVLASLNHPNIAAIYGFEEGEDTSALVLELVEGETLADRIARGPLPLTEALPIARQICEALEAAHDHGIVHRDLKPANIKVRSDGLVKVLDFGLAKALERETPARDVSLSPTITSPAATAVGVIMGTAAYMSPDQARGKPADKRADLWAFGCVVYEMLTGTRAFASGEVSDTLAFILTREPDWSALPQQTPIGIQKLLRRCLEKDRKKRLADASDARLEIDDALSTSSQEISSPVRSTRGPRIAWAIAITGLAIAAALAVPAALHLFETTPQPLLTRLDVVTPPTSDVFSFAVSPDGRQLVFVATDDGRPRLWLRALDQAAARPLPGSDGASWPFWSPDSRAIGFFADGKLKRLNLTGGAPQEIAIALQGRGGTWNDSNIIVYAPAATGGLMRVSASGGAPTPVTKPPVGASSHRSPQFLPDGRRFLFQSTLGALETRGVYIGTLDGAEPTRVIAADVSAAYAPPGFLLFVSATQLVAQPFDEARNAVTGEPVPIAQDVSVDQATVRGGFSVSNAGVVAHRTGVLSPRQLAWVNRSGTVLRSIRPAGEGALGTLAHPAISPDGQHVIVSLNVLGNPDVWLVTVNTSVPSRFTSDPGVDFSAVWEPNGKRIVFRSSRSGPHDLFSKPADSSADERPLLVSDQNKSPLDWSRDGRFLLYSVADPKTASDMWVLPMAVSPEGRKPFPVLQTSFDEMQGQFSPDGRWIAYASNESGPYEIYMKPFPEGGRVKVSTGGGTQPQWGHNGRELFYVSTDQRLMGVPMQSGRDERTPILGTPAPLFATNLAVGGTVAEAGFSARAQYVVTRDGVFVMNVSTEPAVPLPIKLVLNWTSALQK